MSKTAAEIRELIEGMGRAGAYEIIEGTVDDVNEEEYIIDVEIAEGVVLSDVKLRAVSDGSKAGFVCLPKKGSHITFAQVRGEDDYVLLKTSELDKVIIEIEDVKLVASKDGFEVSKSGTSLKDVLKALADLLKEFKVTTPSGPSTSVLPDTLQAIIDFETKFNSLLNA